MPHHGEDDKRGELTRIKLLSLMVKPQSFIPSSLTTVATADVYSCVWNEYGGANDVVLTFRVN